MESCLYRDIPGRNIAELVLFGKSAREAQFQRTKSRGSFILSTTFAMVITVGAISTRAENSI